MPPTPTPDTIAHRLGRFAAGLDLADVPPDTLHHAKLQLLDAVGIALASASYDFGRRAANGLAPLSQGDALLIGLPHRLAVRDAVLVNAVLVHGLDYDDTAIAGRVHPSSFCAPPALTLAAERRSSGRELLAAYIAGLECGIRIGAASKGGFPRNGFDAGGIVGHFAASIVASRLLGLDAAQTAMAQSLALSTTSGTREFVADMAWTKRLHPGWAGVGGITAALLAKGGFRGPDSPYEGRFGLYRQYIRDGENLFDLDLAAADLGRVWQVDGVAFKPVPACFFNIAPIDAAIAVATDNDIDPDAIAAVKVLVPQAAVETVCEPAASKRRPRDGYAGEFSVYYSVAAGLMRRRFTLADHETAAVTDPAVQALADKVDYAVDPDSTFPKYYSGVVRVTMQDGRSFEHREYVHRGSAERPFGEADVIAKFRENAARSVDRSRADAIQRAILELDALADASALKPLLAPAAAMAAE